MRLPGNTGELQQFPHALNWMRTVLPRLVEVEASLRNLLETSLRHMSWTNRVDTRRAIFDTEWTAEQLQAWENVLEMAQLTQQSHPRPEWTVVMFSDASDLFLGVV